MSDISKQPKQLLTNEADVDVKVSYRLLTKASPDGLGIPDACIRTQATLAAMVIDKGENLKKNYKPEFVAYSRGLPLLVVEDKAPGQSVANALRECQLYAHEINKYFPAEVNPCQWCIATDGQRLLLSRWDSGVPILEAEVNTILPGTEPQRILLQNVGNDALRSHAAKLRTLAAVRRQQARMLVVGNNNEDVPHNAFGAQIVADYGAIFEPESMADREFIAKHAYIKSRHREQHADEIDRIVAGAFNVSVPGSKPIRDTGRADEIVSLLNRGRRLENQILLLVGRRGAGKTTFVDYLRVKKLPPDLRDRTIWIHLNLNDAKKGKLELQDWIMRELVEKLEASAPKTNFNNPAVTKELYGDIIKEFEARALFLLERGSDAYNQKLTDFLISLHKDYAARAKALKQFLATKRGKLLVIVFDNCDKRDRDDQLNCFEAARYIQKEVESLIILPIRDVTYHLYKDEPPLDASANSMVFTISPPRLGKIITRRIELILEQMNVKASRDSLEITLAGATIRYPKTELAFFLTSLYQSLYTHDKLIRSVILGLSGNDIRRAMKIFIEFLRSGLISQHYYLAIKASEGRFTFPADLVKQVLIRAGRVYFEEQNSFLANLFQSRVGSGFFGNLIRAMILLTLDELRTANATSARSTFIEFVDLHKLLVACGFEEELILEEVNSLLERGLLIADHQQKAICLMSDRLRVSPSGVIHIRLMSDLVYVGACAEDAYLEDTHAVEDIARRLRFGNGRAQMFLPTLTLNGADLWRSIAERMDQLVQVCGSVLDGPVREAARRLQLSQNEWARRRKGFYLSKRSWDDIGDFFERHVAVAVMVTSVQKAGVRVRLPGGFSGWIPGSRLPDSVKSSLERRTVLECHVIKWDDERQSFLLAYDKPVAD